MRRDGGAASWLAKQSRNHLVVKYDVGLQQQNVLIEKLPRIPEGVDVVRRRVVRGLDVADLNSREARPHPLPNHIAFVADHDDGLANLHGSERPQRAQEERFAVHGDKTLREVRGEWLESISLAGGQNDRPAHRGYVGGRRLTLRSNPGRSITVLGVRGRRARMLFRGRGFGQEIPRYACVARPAGSARPASVEEK